MLLFIGISFSFWGGMWTKENNSLARGKRHHLSLLFFGGFLRTVNKKSEKLITTGVNSLSLQSNPPAAQQAQQKRRWFGVALAKQRRGRTRLPYPSCAISAGPGLTGWSARWIQVPMEHLGVLVLKTSNSVFENCDGLEASLFFAKQRPH